VELAVVGGGEVERPLKPVEEQDAALPWASMVAGSQTLSLMWVTEVEAGVPDGC
jgi:hypothetical protein